MDQYLNACDIIDWRSPSIVRKAAELAQDKHNNCDIARACFLFVRDDIKHSWDYQLERVTLKASEVLQYGSGYCYAKSHLLAALLRANGIPAALCYQRLVFDVENEALCLHGLNAVYLEQHGWYRIDARGNKAGVDAQFQPPVEQLAFSTAASRERDIEGLFSQPLSCVVEVLEHHDTVAAVAENLPDLSD